MSSPSRSERQGSRRAPAPAGAGLPPARRGPWALSLLAAIALHGAAVVWLPAPGAMAVSASPGTGTPLQVRWIGARGAPVVVHTVDARHVAGEPAQAAPAPGRVAVPAMAVVPAATARAPDAGVAAAPGDARHARRDRSDDAANEDPVIDSADGATGIVVPVPDVPMPGPVTVLRLALSVDPEGHVAALDALDDDALDALVDAVREAFLGQPLSGVGAAVAPRWRLELRFVEGEARVHWRLWRMS